MDSAETVKKSLQQRHLRIGWWTLFCFLCLGLVLDLMHGFKVDWYLNVAHQTRRMMWTLAHTHGTLLGILHLAFALTLAITTAWSLRSVRIVSGCLLAATVLMPGGFLLGGIWTYDGDPGLGGLLVPPGGLLLMIAVSLTAWKARSA